MLATDRYVQSLESRNLLASLGGAGSDVASGVAYDSSGNLYVAGMFSGTVDFDPSSATKSLTASGSCSTFVAKYTSAGALVWARRIGGLTSAGDVWDSGQNRTVGLALDSTGNAYVTGPFSGTRDFDPGSATSNLTSLGRTDIFVAKITNGGNFGWARRLGGTSYDAGSDIALDPSKNVIVGGYFGGTADFNPSSSTYNLKSTGNVDAFVCKLSSAGNFVWADRFGGTSGSTDDDETLAVATDTSGNIYAGGFFTGKADFDPTSGVSTMTSAGATDAFVVRLTSAGKLSWARRAGAGMIDGVSDLAVSGTSLYASGLFAGTVDFNPSSSTANLTSAGGYDAFAWKLTTGGSYSTARRFGGTGNDAAWTIAVRGSTVALGGFFEGTADFNPTSSVYNLTSVGGQDAFAAKLTTSLTLSWARSTGTSKDDWGLAGTIDSSGGLTGVGIAGGNGEFDEDDIQQPTGGDIFIGRLSSSGVVLL